MVSMAPVATFDLFSALLDSRQGGTQAFARLGSEHGWEVDAGSVYDRWDAANKALQRDHTGAWTSFREMSRLALRGTYAEMGLSGDADRDADAVLASTADWPLWPDAAEALPALAAEGIAGHRVGVLSNVDDDIFARTRAAAFVDPAVALTSERLGAYKPSARLYSAAMEQVDGALVHVATSARDVRGALEAGCPTVRLRRPGHRLDPDGPQPEHEVDDVRHLAHVLEELRAKG
jgi:2-haloacid dehalogenase